MTIRRRNVLAAIALVVGAPLLAIPALGAPVGAETAATTSAGEVVVMTRNLYLGADVSRALELCPTCRPPPRTCGSRWRRPTSPRAYRFCAAEVVAAPPAVIGVQEATTWECRPSAFAGTTVVYDFTQQFLDATGRRGHAVRARPADGRTALNQGYSIPAIPRLTRVVRPGDVPAAVRHG